MSEAGGISPVIRRVPVGLSQFATYVKSEPGEYDVSVHTKLQSSKGHWTLTGIDVSLSAGGDLLQPMLRSLEADHRSELLIVADTVRVKDAIMLPGTHVKIHARVLEFADGAQINTQATAYTDADIPTEPNAPGRVGRHSGPVELFVGELNILGQDNQPVIVTDGTDGTVGGPGDEGMPGDKVNGIDFRSSEGSEIQTAVNTHRQWWSIREKGLELSEKGAVVSVTVGPNPAVDDDRTIQNPSVKPDLNGRDPREDGLKPKPKPEGRAQTPQEKLEEEIERDKIYKHLPGVAGRGTWAGYINALPASADLLIQKGAFSMVSGKNAEPRTAKGGEPGHAYKHDDTGKETPVKAYELYTIHDSKLHAASPTDRPNTRTPEVFVREVEGTAGQSKTGAAAQELPDVHLTIGPDPRICEWFHPLQAEVYSAYLTDMSRGGFSDALDMALDDITEGMAPLREAYRTLLPAVDFDDDASQDSFQSAFDAIRGDDYERQADQDAFAPLVKVLTQIDAMKDQATRGLDHYGNPAGWAPNLSFAAQMDLERGAGENAVRALFVSQWLTSASDKIEDIIQSHWDAIVEVRKRRQMDFKRQGEMYEALSSLTVKSERLQADIKCPSSGFLEPRAA